MTFLLSYTLYLNLLRTYTAYFEPIRFTLDNIEFILDNMTPVFLVQLFELHADLNVKGFINIFLFLFRTNKNFLNLNSGSSY